MFRVYTWFSPEFLCIVGTGGIVCSYRNAIIPSQLLYISSWYQSYTLKGEKMWTEKWKQFLEYILWMINWKDTCAWKWRVNVMRKWWAGTNTHSCRWWAMFSVYHLHQSHNWFACFHLYSHIHFLLNSIFTAIETIY